MRLIFYHNFHIHFTSGIISRVNDLLIERGLFVGRAWSGSNNAVKTLNHRATSNFRSAFGKKG